MESIYVLPEYQGMGIGRLFWGEASKLITKGKPVKVDVVTYNKKAIDFYQKLGFVVERHLINEESKMSVSKLKLPEMEMILIPS